VVIGLLSTEIAAAARISFELITGQYGYDISIWEQDVRWILKSPDYPLMPSPIFCYYQPRFKTQKTAFFISNITSKQRKPGVRESRFSFSLPNQFCSFSICNNVTLKLLAFIHRSVANT
jgi:hypothetical protein